MEDARPVKARRVESRSAQPGPEGPEGPESDECPVCYQAYGVRRRTKTNPFGCEGIVRHAICSECNRRMFERHDDACPLCRADRCDTSSMGHRLPLPNNPSFEIIDSLTGYSLATPIVHSGNMIVFPVSDNDGSPAELFVLRQNHSQRSEEQQEEDRQAASNLVREITNEPMFRVALEGLRNPGRVPVASFLGRVRRAARLSRNS
jgi:hypothetical protein